MSRRFDNKKLLVIFGILIIILLLTFVIKVPRQNSTLKGSIVDLDTADVARIECYPKKSAGEPFKMVKEKNRWTVIQGNITAEPYQGSVQNIFREILSIRPQSLAARDKSKWKDYDLVDSLAIRVKLLDVRNETLADLLIGKFDYRQVADPNNYYGGNNIEGTSYVRVNGEDEVYAVDGFLAFSFSGTFNDWRNKAFTRCRREDVLKISFIFPGDSSYTLQKNDKVWLADGRPADSAKVANYLSVLSYADGQDFEDGFRPDANPEYQVNVEGNNLLNFTVKCYPFKGTGEFIMNSSLYPDAYFTSKRKGLFDRIVKPKTQFFGK